MTIVAIPRFEVDSEGIDAFVDCPIKAARAKRISTATDILWHKRLGHASDERVDSLGIHLKTGDLLESLGL
jgi:hypothetical protein